MDVGMCSFNLQFDAPELVVVGMQSDGKSSFVEGLLGFQFNIVESSASPIATDIHECMQMREQW